MSSKKYLLSEYEIDTIRILAHDDGRHRRPLGSCIDKLLDGREYREPAQVTNSCPCGARLTCRDFGGKEDTIGELYDFACSECGFCSDVTEPNFCPNCGAKVVDE